MSPVESSSSPVKSTTKESSSIVVSLSSPESRTQILVLSGIARLETFRENGEVESAGCQLANEEDNIEALAMDCWLLHKYKRMLPKLAEEK